MSKNHKPESHKFDAEVSKVFKLVIHSIYQNKEIFLRELISNASDACDKLKFLSLKDNAILQNDKDLKISITPNEKEGTLTIEDNGLGMTKAELIENLGTIARSGTQKFLEEFSKAKKADTQLIGQFGVGFYSSFMVADEVTVFSKSYKDGEIAYKWHSTGDDGFEIEPAPEFKSRGTKIILKIKKEEQAILSPWKIRNVIKTYSNFTAFPIILHSENNEIEQINEASALWLRDKKDVEAETYENFYKSISHLGGDKPWLTLHNKAEGNLQYINLLFIPSSKPFDLYHPDRQTRVKLFIKRTFIAETGLELIPQYLRFLRGIIDSEDLPLNISRETIQNNSVLAKIKSSITKKVLSELRKKLEKDRADYLPFWNNFGGVLKEGLCDFLEGQQKDDILNACLFHSNLKNELITLKEYKDNLKDDQKEIFYLISDSLEKAKTSPQIEGFTAKGIEVLLLVDNVDQFWTNVVNEYGDLKLASVTKSSSDDFIENQNKEENKDDTINTAKLVEFIKQTLKDKVKDVVITHKLTSTPAVLAIGDSGMDIRFERFLVENKQLKESSKKIFEINPNHKIIKNLSETFESNMARSKDIIHLLFDQANILEGEPIEDTAGFIKRMNGLVESFLGG